MAKSGTGGAAAGAAISDAEWDVMKVVWDAEPVPACDVADQARRPAEWHPQTVKTLLTRLVAKGGAGVQGRGQAVPVPQPHFPRGVRAAGEPHVPVACLRRRRRRRPSSTCSPTRSSPPTN